MIIIVLRLRSGSGEMKMLETRGELERGWCEKHVSWNELVWQGVRWENFILTSTSKGELLWWREGNPLEKPDWRRIKRVGWRENLSLKEEGCDLQGRAISGLKKNCFRKVSAAKAKCVCFSISHSFTLLLLFESFIHSILFLFSFLPSIPFTSNGSLSLSKCIPVLMYAHLKTVFASEIQTLFLGFFLKPYFGKDIRFQEGERRPGKSIRKQTVFSIYFRIVLFSFLNFGFNGERNGNVDIELYVNKNSKKVSFMCVNFPLKITNRLLSFFLVPIWN